MANNKTTYVLEIDAEVSSLKSKLETTKIALDKLGDSSFSNDVGKKITSILTQLEKLQKKASQPINSKATFSSLEKGFGGIVVDAKNLLSELEKISGMTTREKLSLLPDDEAKKFKEALNAVQAYTKAVEKAEKARIRSQERRKGERETTSAQLSTARETHKTAKASYERATARGTEYGDAKAIVAQAEAAKKAQKEIDALEKQLKRYQKRLEELNSIENRTEEQEAELQTTRSNVKSVGGKIGARKKIVKNGPDEKTLTAANKTIEDQVPVIEALEQSVAQAEKEITRLENALTKLDEAIKNNSTEITTSQADYRILYEQAKKLGVSLEGVTEDVNSTNVRILTERMRELVNDGVKPLDNAIEQVTPDVKELGNVAAQTGEKISIAEEHFSSMVDNQSRIDNLKENIKQFIGWAGASKVLSAAMRNAFEDIKELDAAMTEIAVVTDFSIGDMWDQMPTYTARANELGLEITEVYEASALFYQQGLDTNEMIALSNETLKMAKIAGLDAAEATDRMTAALRGFNMELDESSAQKVADVYSELAAITASDVDEISSAMTKTASIASSAGMEFETTAAFLSQIIETTRESAETAGTAMKTVIARFQELKKSPDEIGEVDGEMIDANAIEGALRSVGVSLRDAGGQFRELDDVFLELSSKWDGLDKNTQRYIATIAAGSRQQSRFIAMMQDYGRTQELVTAANNSVGASQKQYEKTMESLETKLKKLDNAWTEFSTGLLNSDVVKFAVDFLTSILNALNRVTQGFEGFTGSLSKIGTLVAIFQTAKIIVGKFFDEVIAKIYTSAVRAGENIAQGTKDGINNKGGVKDSIGRMSSYSQVREGASLIQKSKQVRVGDSAQVQVYRNQKNANIEKRKGIENRYEQAIIEAGSDVVKIREAENKRLEELTENEKELTKIEENRYYTQEEVNEMSKQGFKQIVEGAQAAGQAITMVGVGLGVVGQLFAEAGNEEAAEFFQSVGNIFTFVGSAITGVAALIPAFTTIFGGLVAKMVAGGISVQAAWWWVVLIVAAVVTLVALIVFAVNAVKNASPEAKLERAQEAADKAAKAAERATEAYENLKSAFEELGDGYEALEDLTRGTEEWNEAVKNINKSVLDLIEQYPELAKYIDNEGGVLKIDFDNSNVQQILKDAERSAIVAQNTSTLANFEVAKKEDDVERSKLKTSERVGHYETVGDTTVWVEEKENTEALAKALASGVVVNNGERYEVKDKDALARLGIDESELERFYTLTGAGSDALKDFGDSLLETQEKGEASFAAVAASAYQLADTLSMTTPEQEQAGNIVDDATVKGYYNEKIKELDGIDFTNDEGSNAINDDQKKIRDDAIKAQYGDAARIEGNTVTYRDKDGQKTEELTNEEIKAIIANNYATTKTTDAVEMAPAVIDQVIKNMGYDVGSAEAAAIEAATQDREGGSLTNSQVESLLGIDEAKLKQAYANLTEEQKKVFGTEQDYLDKTQGAAKIADNAFAKARESVAQTGAELKGFMTSDMAKGFADKMQQVYDATGQEGVKKVQDAYNTLIAGQSDEVASEITAMMNGVDWTNQESLLNFQIQLEEQYGYSREEAAALTETMGEETKATSNLAHTVEIFGAFYHTTQRLNAALQKTADLQWEYERMLKRGADATELATNLEEQRQSILTQGQEALNAYEQARADQRTVYASGVNLEGVGKDLTQYVKFNDITGQYDLTELQRQINAGELGAEGSDTRKAVEDYVSRLEEANELSQEQLETAKESYEQLEEINEQAEEAYWSLYDQIGELLVSEIEKEISLQSDLLDATQSANDKLINKIQEQIDTERQRRENEKTEQNIADLQNQVAYLGMDSSGANSLALLDLEKQIQEEEQAYQDSLIDQSLQNLQDANEKAAEQRERQIALQEQQLKLYRNSEAYQKTIQETLDIFLAEVENGVDVSATDIGSRLEAAGYTKGMNPEEEKQYWETLAGESGMALYWDDVANNTAADEGLTMAKLLSAIETNTSQEELSKQRIQADAQAARQKDIDFFSATGFDITGTGTDESFTSTNEQGKSVYDTTAASEYTKTVSAIANDDNKTKLVSGNASASAYYSMVNGTSAVSDGQALSQSEFYAKLNAGEEISMGGKTFTRTGLESWLKGDEDSVDNSYWAYMDAYKTSHTAEAQETFETNLEYLKNGTTSYDHVGWKMRQALVLTGQATNMEDADNQIKKRLAKEFGWGIDATFKIQDKKYWNDNKVGDMNMTIDTKNDNKVRFSGKKASGQWLTVLDNIAKMAGDKNVVYIRDPSGTGTLWIRNNDKWASVKNQKTEDSPKGLAAAAESQISKLFSFKTGGLADFTGPAWLDGTPSKPEYILNSAQTERFFSLVDVLESFNKNSSMPTNSGDNYFDINISVDKLENDYDVEKIADKIRQMIYEDATYRNVNSINHIR